MFEEKSVEVKVPTNGNVQPLKSVDEFIKSIIELNADDQITYLQYVYKQLKEYHREKAERAYKEAEYLNTIANKFNQ